MRNMSCFSEMINGLSIEKVQAKEEEKGLLSTIYLFHLTNNSYSFFCDVIIGLSTGMIFRTTSLLTTRDLASCSLEPVVSTMMNWSNLLKSTLATWEPNMRMRSQL